MTTVERMEEFRSLLRRLHGVTGHGDQFEVLHLSAKHMNKVHEVVSRQKTRGDLVRAMRKVGKVKNLIVRVNFLCCQSCAGEEISSMWNKQPKDQKSAGYLYWHQQDEQDVQRRGHAYIAFGSLNDYKDKSKDEIATLDIGRALVAHLHNEGFVYDWHDSADSRIEVMDLVVPERFQESAGWKYR